MTYRHLAWLKAGVIIAASAIPLSGGLLVGWAVGEGLLPGWAFYPALAAPLPAYLALLYLPCRWIDAAVTRRNRLDYLLWEERFDRENRIRDSRAAAGDRRHG